MKSGKTRLFFSLIFLAFSGMGVNAQAILFNEVFPYATTINVCGYEEIYFEGNVHVVAKTTNNFDEYQFNFLLKGVGLTTGDEYVYHETHHRKTHIEGDRAGWNQTWMYQSRITGLGDAPDFDIRWVVHVNFNAADEMNIVYKLDPGCAD